MYEPDLSNALQFFLWTVPLALTLLVCSWLPELKLRVIISVVPDGTHSASVRLVSRVIKWVVPNGTCRWQQTKTTQK